MGIQFCASVGALAFLSCVAGLGLLQAGSAPKTSGSTITVYSATSGASYEGPGQLVETSPGTFATVGIHGNPSAYLLTRQGAVTSLYTFPAGLVPTQPLVQAVNGRVYGYQQSIHPNTQSNFSFGLTGGFQAYPLTLPVVSYLSIQLPNGELYGTQWNYYGNNAFFRMTLGGAMSVIHNFTAQEGVPFALPILGSDGNFYGISGVRSSSAAITQGMVYRIAPGGNLKILASYPDGRPGPAYPPGTYPETLLQADNGKLYGTAALGGKNSAGAIFELSLSGTLKTLYQFPNYANGVPEFLVQGTDGNLYGAAQGIATLGGASSLFRITPAGQFQTMQVLNGGTVGDCPCRLTVGSDGKFYGTTLDNGPGGGGVAWVWDLGLPPPQPKVTGVVPTAGATGATVIVNGKFLLGAVAVSFNGTPATTFSNISANYVSVTVPAGATTGPITVTTPNGSSTSTGVFTVE